MNISIILGHPKPGSFNHAIAQTAAETLKANGHQVILHNLCAEGFDPLLPPAELAKGAVLPPDIQKHCDEIVKADGIIIVHPNWWGQPPAILKGWVDRVLRVGVAYTFKTGDNGEGVPVGLLKAKKALVFTTSNTPREREREVFGDPLEALWGKCVFPFCGVDSFERRNFEVVVASTEEERKGWLQEVSDRVGKAFSKA
jgi:putative NADPH-quinone reductase